MAEDKKITDITEKKDAVDTDLMVIGNAGTAVWRRLSFGNLWKWIAKKIAAEVWNELTTSDKTILGAISELNSNMKTEPYKRGNAISNGSDLNEYINPGVYYSAGSKESATMINVPFSNAGFRLEIREILGKTSITQMAYKSSSGAMFYRTYLNGTWTDWVTL